jgi:outer membrane protein TolC
MNMRIYPSSYPYPYPSDVGQVPDLRNRRVNMQPNPKPPGTLLPLPPVTAPPLNPPNWHAQNVPPSHDSLTPEGLFNVQGLESRLAAANVYGSKVLIEQLQSLGSPQVVGNVTPNFEQLLRGELTSLKGTLGINIPLISDAGAQKVVAKERNNLAEAVSNGVEQDARFLTNGLLLDASTRKTSIVDLKEIVATQKQIVEALDNFSKDPNSKVDSEQVDEAKRALLDTTLKLRNEERLLNQTLVQLKKLTGNDTLDLAQIPTLKHSQETAPIVTSSKLLMNQKEALIDNAIQNNSDIQIISAGLELAKAQLKAVKESKITVSANSGNIFMAGYEFVKDPIGKFLGWIFGSTKAEVKDIQAQVADAEAKIAEKELQLDEYKKEVRSRLEDQLNQVNSTDIKDVVDTKKQLVDITFKKYMDLEKIATDKTSTLSIDERLQAKVKYLEARQAYNESAPLFMASMNRIVALGGGYGDAKSALFRAFNGNFNLFWGPNKGKQP